MGFRQAQPLGRSPCAFVRQAKVANIAFVHLHLQGLKAFVHIVHNLLAAAAPRFIGPVFAEHIGPTVWPVKLIKINVIGFQTAQVSFDRFGNGCRADGGAVTHMRHAFP